MDNLGGVLARLAKDGIEPARHMGFLGLALACLNSDNVGGIMLELIGYKKPKGEKGHECRESDSLSTVPQSRYGIWPIGGEWC